MSYDSRNQTLQNVLGTISGLILLGFSFLFFYTYDISSRLANAFVSVFVYWLVMILAGMSIGLVSFRKDGFKISLILAPITFIGSLIYILIIYYTSTTPFDIYLDDVLHLFKLGPGFILIFIGCFLGVFIKYKAQKGANFSLHLIKKDN